MIPSLKKSKFLHAGPPIQLNKLCRPHIGSLIGAILFEGLAETPAQAKKRIDDFEVEIEPAHHFHAVAGAGHMISASQPLFVVYNKVHRIYAYTHMKEETFKALRYGVYDNNVIRKLYWLKDKVAPALSSALKDANGIDKRALISKSIMMGDDGHNRCQASTALFGKMIMPMLFRADVSRELISDTAHLLFNKPISLTSCLLLSVAIRTAASPIPSKALTRSLILIKKVESLYSFFFN